mmetsp:Transcript_22519/g.39809  ORF Transcript_22519/g.39809 Transcript_22519/m.39809 type:complete len:283 (-) Transcript_22519:1004-1852(-)
MHTHTHICICMFRLHIDEVLQAGFEPNHRSLQLVQIPCIRNPNAPIVSETCPWNQRDLVLPKQVRAEVRAISYHLLPVGSVLSVVGADLRQHVECPHWPRECHLRNGREKIYHKLALFCEVRPHRVDGAHSHRQRCHSGMLRDGARARRDLALHLRAQLGHLQRRSYVPQAEARHRVALREAVDYSRAVVHAGQSRDGVVPGCFVGDVLVDFVRKHEDPRVFPKHRRQLLESLHRVHGAGRVARRAEDEDPRSRRDARLQELCAEQVRVTGFGPDDLGFAAR